MIVKCFGLKTSLDSKNYEEFQRYLVYMNEFFLLEFIILDIQNESFKIFTYLLIKKEETCYLETLLFCLKSNCISSNKIKINKKSDFLHFFIF